jgi:DNA-directed RNA polymerase subunit L
MYFSISESYNSIESFNYFNNKKLNSLFKIKDCFIMLNIISYIDNVLKIEEDLNNEGHTLITPLQNIVIKEYNCIFGYNYKHPGENEIEILINDLNIIKNVIQKILLIIKDIKNDMEKIKINKNHLSLYFRNINKQLVNSIRRVLISEIETFAFDNIEIVENNTFIPDEVWKKRIELIPIKSKYDNIISNGKDDNYLILNKEYNINSNNYVISNDLVDIQNKKIEIVYNDIIINKLNLNQKINIKAHYKKGIANQHSKWSSITNIPLNVIWEFYIKKENVLKILPFYISYNINIIEDANGISVQTSNKNCKNILKKLNYDNNFNSEIIYSKIIKMDIKSIGQYDSDILFDKALNILEIKYRNFLNKLNIFLESSTDQLEAIPKNLSL